MTDRRPPTPEQLYRQLAEYLDARVQHDKLDAGGEPVGSKAAYLAKWMHLLEPKEKAHQ